MQNWVVSLAVLAFVAVITLADIRYFADPDPLVRIIKERSARSAAVKREFESKRASRETRTNNVFGNEQEELASNSGK